MITGLIRKEWAIQLNNWLLILNRLLIGPLIAFVTTALLYRSFFDFYPSADVGGITQNTYRSFIIFGFLGHMFLNTGYHSFSAKLVSEWGARTLPLLWLAPCSRFSLLVSLLSIEIVRCLAFLLIGIAFLSWSSAGSFLQVGLEMGPLFLIFGFGVMLGLARTALIFTHLGRAELLDNIYLIFVFTACPYIPVFALPQGLQAVVKLNPLRYGLQALREIWLGHNADALQSLGIFIGGASLMIAVFAFLAWLLRRKIFEAAFK